MTLDWEQSMHVRSVLFTVRPSTIQQAGGKSTAVRQQYRALNGNRSGDTKPRMKQQHSRGGKVNKILRHRGIISLWLVSSMSSTMVIEICHMNLKCVVGGAT
jgi:hypothetical protein